MSETKQHTHESSAPLPGAILKRCREYHCITLHEAAETTKIGINYLSALEEDRISAFPNLAYLKGFLRIYTTYLGLNPDDMLRIYERFYDPDGQIQQPAEKIDAPPGPRAFRWGNLVLPLILLLLMFTTAAIINFRTVEKIPIKAAAPIQHFRYSSISGHPLQTAVSSSVQATPTIHETPPETKPQKKNPDYSTDASKPVTMKTEARKSFIAAMKVTGNGSLVVVIDGAPSQEYELEIGDFFEWKAEKSIALELDNGAALEIEVNGRHIPPVSSAGRAVYVVIDENGVKK